jgi:hypothetical protein
MQTIAPLFVAAVVVAIVFVIGVVVVAVLCLLALRHDASFRADIRAASFSLHVSTSSSRDRRLTPITARREAIDTSEAQAKKQACSFS